MALNRFNSQHNYLVYFQEFPTVFFTSKTGGEVSREVTQEHPGGGGPPENISGPTTVSPLVLTKPYDAVQDMQLEVWAAGWANGIEAPLTLVVQPVNSTGIPAGKSDQYMGCALVTLQKPDVTKGSAESAKLTITVQPQRML